MTVFEYDCAGFSDINWIRAQQRAILPFGVQHQQIDRLASDQSDELRRRKRRRFNRLDVSCELRAMISCVIGVQ